MAFWIDAIFEQSCASWGRGQRKAILAMMLSVHDKRPGASHCRWTQQQFHAMKRHRNFLVNVWIKKISYKCNGNVTRTQTRLEHHASATCATKVKAGDPPTGRHGSKKLWCRFAFVFTMHLIMAVEIQTKQWWTKDSCFSKWQVCKFMLPNNPKLNVLNRRALFSGTTHGSNMEAMKRTLIRMCMKLNAGIVCFALMLAICNISL